MITAATTQGLVVSTSLQATPALDELIVCCGWPAVLQATPQRFRRELLLLAPELSLFWLDDERDVATTVQLLAWLGSCQPAVRRIAVGYRLPAEVEVAVRSAKAHVYLAADDNIRSLVYGSLSPWLRSGGRSAAEFTKASIGCELQGGSPESLGASLHPSGPP